MHLIPGQGDPADRTGEAIDHVGFRLADHDGMRRRLDGLGIPYSRMELPELGERRLFIRTPTGILGGNNNSGWEDRTWALKALAQASCARKTAVSLPARAATSTTSSCWA